MNRYFAPCALAAAALAAVVTIALAGCGGAKAKENPAAEAPPPAQVIPANQPDLFKVDHPEQFPIAQAAPYLSGGLAGTPRAR